MKTNLNLLSIRDDHEYQPIAELRNSTSAGTATAHFQELESELVKFVSSYPVVVGCVAWLTNVAVLAALATRKSVSVLVQKEDFLRPDTGGWSKDVLRTAYSALPGMSRYDFRPTYGYSTCCGDGCDSIRCVGIFERGSRTYPRMHHKFLVGCNFPGRDEHGAAQLGFCEPLAVWTGSFNPTENGTRCLENAVVITDPGIVQAYFSEWGVVFGLSEQLDWESDYVEPEFRIGT